MLSEKFHTFFLEEGDGKRYIRHTEVTGRKILRMSTHASVVTDAIVGVLENLLQGLALPTEPIELGGRSVKIFNTNPEILWQLASIESATLDERTKLETARRHKEIVETASSPQDFLGKNLELVKKAKEAHKHLAGKLALARRAPFFHKGVKDTYNLIGNMLEIADTEIQIAEARLELTSCEPQNPDWGALGRLNTLLDKKTAISESLFDNVTDIVLSAQRPDSVRQ